MSGEEALASPAVVAASLAIVPLKFLANSYWNKPPPLFLLCHLTNSHVVFNVRNCRMWNGADLLPPATTPCQECQSLAPTTDRPWSPQIGEHEQIYMALS
jgi:hypothetical protein